MLRQTITVIILGITTTFAQDVLMESDSEEETVLLSENTGTTYGALTKTAITGLSETTEGTGILASGGMYGIWAKSNSENDYFNAGLHVEGTQASVGDARGIDAYASGGSYNAGVISTVAGRSGATNYGFYANLGSAVGTHSYGIYTTVPNDTANHYAGYFNGKVVVTTGHISSPSDEMFKKNIQPLNSTLTKILALRPKSYDMRTEEFKDKINLGNGHRIGFIAQEVQTLFPELVQEVTTPSLPPTSPTKAGPGKNIAKIESVKFKTLDEVGLIPALVRAMQEQQVMIESLQAQLAELKTREQ